jgi:uncharacterized protein
MKIAIIGGGISGITSAWRLQKKHQVTLFEAAKTLGGHTQTHLANIDSETIPIDTGFIVFNKKTYPNFLRLLDEWDVPYIESDMSFSVSCADTGLEYTGGHLRGLFPSLKNLCNRSFLRVLRDIPRFNRQAKKYLTTPQLLDNMSLGEFIQRAKLSPDFCHYYLYPMAAAIWSTPLHHIADFPAYFLLNFYDNHGLLNIFSQPQWYCIDQGAHEYIKKFTGLFQGDIHLNTPIYRVERQAQQVTLLTQDGKRYEFDAVIFACHADQTLALLDDKTDIEQEILSAFPYQRNAVFLHTDIRFMPKHRVTWASWNYLLNKGGDNVPCLSYYMNKLHQLSLDTPLIVTLNPQSPIDPKQIITQHIAYHPQFSQASMQAQKRLQEINGQHNTYFCGAYWGNGFHEDGVNSAINAIKPLL